MLVIIALVVVWILGMILVWAMCVASAAGDRALGYDPSRHEVPEPQDVGPAERPTQPADPAPPLTRVRFSG